MSAPRGGGSGEGDPSPAGFRRREVLTLAAITAAVWLLGLSYPLLESTEGRYASVAAAMVWSGDWLDPAFNHVPHFTKPPLAYWFGALGITVFGRNEFAVRLPATLALAVCVFLTWRLGRDLGLGRQGSAGAAVLAALSPLAVAQGRMLSPDIFLWIGVLAFYLGLLKPAAKAPPDAAGNRAPGGDAVLAPGSRSLGRTLLVGFGLGWGFLAKGPVVLLWTLFPLLGLAGIGLVRRIGRADRLPSPDASGTGAAWRLSRLRSPAALGLALALALPWYVIEVVRHPPGLLSYWLGSETVNRFLTTSHGRAEPFWYFILLLPGMVLPWIPEIVRGLRRVRGAGWPWIPVLLWIVLPVVFLSFSGSKRPHYLLPAVAPLALIGGLALESGFSRGTRVRIAVWTALVLLSPLVMYLDLVAPSTRTLARYLRDVNRPVVLYRTLPSSLPFYLGHPVPMAGVDRPRPFDGATQGLSAPPLSRAVAEGTVVLARRKDLERLTAELEASEPALSGRVVVLLEEGKRILAGLDMNGETGREGP